jgi:hypothetical protein
MANDSFSVKVNRTEGSVEITGPDKAWVAEQLDKVSGVIDDGPIPPPEKDQADKGSAGKPVRNTKRRRKSSASPGSGDKKSGEELREKLTSPLQKKLETFRSEREANFKTAQDQAAIIATFLEDELKLPGIDAQELAAVFDVMGWRAPANPRAVINNARSRNHYFRGWSNGKAALSAQGKNFGRIDSKNGSEDS